MEKKRTLKDSILTVVLGILSLAWIYPIFMILFNCSANGIGRIVSVTP